MIRLLSQTGGDDDKEYEDNGAEIFKFDPENNYKESGFIAQEVEQIPELIFFS